MAASTNTLRLHRIIPVIIAIVIFTALAIGGLPANSVVQAIVLTATVASKQSSTGQEKIAFVDSNYIYLMNPDGSERAPLAENPNRNVIEGLRWSPDGKQIAFPMLDGLYSMNSVGQNQRLIGRPLAEFTPQKNWPWSPDGSRLVFIGRYDNVKFSEVAITDADGSHLTYLTNDNTLKSSPAWSPDGKRIAFTVGDRDPKIHLINRDGSNEIELAKGFMPVWSPNGSRIAFIQNWQIAVINIDGSELQTTKGIVSNNIDEITWSPDGKQIAIAAYNTLVMVDITDQSFRTVFRAKGNIRFAWSPNGKRIAIISTNSGIFVVNADGSNPVELVKEVDSNKATLGWTIAWLTAKQHAGILEVSAKAAEDIRKFAGAKSDRFIVSTNKIRTTTVVKPQLTFNNWQSVRPSWSADGKRIAYFIGDPNSPSRHELRLMNSDGTEQRRLPLEIVLSVQNPPEAPPRVPWIPENAN